MLAFNRRLMIIALAGTLAACSDSNDSDDQVTPTPEPISYTFTVQVSNLTAGQPFSPIALIAHNEGALWQIGEPASTALELMAEGGDNSVLLQFADAIASVSGDAPVAPGAQTTLTITTDSIEQLKLSLSTMMVNTNDGFTGLNAMDVSSLAVDQTLTHFTLAYDAGTESNSEASGTIPGPADSAEGFNEARDDVNVIAMHPGVVSQYDGLAASILSSEHKFDNPLAKIVITRTQ
ncbi:spondin domain-containing protein [Pseudoalteromonas shioyasakiensis]|uniref:spondin domain-containing protein n=1 Tax=Pseudoalteromonas shioyasakiensis TaxID=1190813 RepID=UPI0021190A29|nr:spondin domain-containing protein [Pseudoalteromonas shioyasakiensis]MCQ8879641.1 spondin domain-containing protein [Pseudoalteromonas shioyasakiensis]